MPWYKTGTVSVTLNSNAVTGSGTAFIANTRVGDAFRGPDGRWYEVTNAPSDTSLSIDPPYQGATASGGGYALAPMQGYVKDSADALRSLVNTYGAKLAALGTTGNYDTLPVSKGGTGGTDQATARTGLGLGTAATGTVQTSLSDTTANRLLAVGAFGWNGGTCIALPVTDLNTVTTSAEYALGAGGTNLPNNAQAWYLRVVRHTTLVLQEVRGMTAANAGQVWVRVYTGAVWTAWSKQASSGANADITSLTGLTTALSVAQGGTGVTTTAALLSALQTAGAYGKSNILGTVSQSAGVPTGAIIEAGSNSAGSFTKFADGTLIAIVRNAGPFAVTANAATIIGPFTTPATFIDSTYAAFAIAIPTATNDIYGVVSAYAVTTSSVSFVFRNGVTGQNVTNIKILLIGRWF